MKNNIKSIKKYREVANQQLIASILETYEKIKAGYTIEMFSLEDLLNIRHFYSYMTLSSAIDMLSVCHKNVAYEEMQSYVGNYPYTIEMKKAFLEQYLKIMEYQKVEMNTEETSLKLA